MIPYIVGPPIKNPADFYGRSAAVARFYEMIGGTQAQSVSVLGLRRAGKTSFLHHVAHPDVMRRHLPHPEQYLVLFVDMSFCRTPAAFYGRFYQRLLQLTGQPVPSQPIMADVYMVESLLCQLGDVRIILLIDEFDQLRVGDFDENFLNELRSLTTHWEYEMACVTASYWDLFQLGTQLGLPPTSPFYNIFYPAPIMIAGLAEEALGRLVCQPAQRQGVRLTAADVAAVRRLAGSLPFFGQATAVSWYRARQAGRAPHEEQVVAALLAQLDPYFGQWWRGLSLAEQMALQAVAAKEPVAWEAELARLQRYGLVVTGEGGETAVNGTLFAHWLQSQAIAAHTATPATRDVPYDHKTLRHTLVNHFSLEELQLLCFDLGVDFEQLPGATKGAKARDLIMYWDRRGALDQLVAAIRLERGALL